MLDIRKKFLISFGVLVVLIATVGAVMIRQVDRLGEAIDVSLRENYRSVVICRKVDDILEEVNGSLLRSFRDGTAEENGDWKEAVRELRAAWDAELRNVTVKGELERAERVNRLLKEYIALLPELAHPRKAETERRTLYDERMEPLFREIKELTGEIQALNQQNMIDANNRARQEAETLHRRVLMILIGCCLFAVILTLLLKNWILNPIARLLALTNEISNGNLDIVLDAKSGDEIGQLSRSFNAMAAALREARRNERIKLERSERTNRDVFSELPTPIAVFDARSGRVEIATRSAEQYFGFRIGAEVGAVNAVWLREIYDRVLAGGGVCTCRQNDGVIQHFIDNKEYFFQPTALPIPADAPADRISAVAVILKDVTMAHEQQELKRSVISTVSHQLKTPLTSLRMSIYLLLDEKIGPLNPGQLDLVMSMRDDGDRLADIMSDLLDLNRVSGRNNLQLEPRRPADLIRAAEERFRAKCLDREIRLETQVAPDVPDVLVAVNRIDYVFDNLIGNALRFTPAGGSITVSAVRREDAVEFTVRDTGCGMPPEVQAHLFEQFYRAPGQEPNSGVGLGLSIAKEIVTALGGSIRVESAAGQGSSFIFSIPVTGAKENQEKNSAQWV